MFEQRLYLSSVYPSGTEDSVIPNLLLNEMYGRSNLYSNVIAYKIWKHCERKKENVNHSLMISMLNKRFNNTFKSHALASSFLSIHRSDVIQ